MSPKLKPLLLPQLVEERRRLEVQKGGDGINSSSIYFASSASPPSDMASPTTPTFPRGHLRYSSSTSSLEMVLPGAAYDCPASPTQASHKPSQGKRLLPDVQEEPVEREEDDVVVEPVHLDMYNSLFEEPSIRQEPDVLHPTAFTDGQYDIDYDIGFLSDNDFTTSPRYPKKRRGGSQSSFSSFSFASRFGSRLPTFSAWKSSKRAASAKSPGSDVSFDRPHSHSRAASSRSSSLSGIGRNAPDRSNEPPMPPTPALSFYESCESVLLPSADADAANGRASLERDRAMATTPLLPPLLTETTSPAAPVRSSAGSMHSPMIYPSSTTAAEQTAARPPSSSRQPTHHHHASLPSPPLSDKPSVSSFRPAASAFAATSDIPPISLLPDTTDSWSDRLGHANFTVLPKPYEPKEPTIEALRQLRADWDRARTDFTRHLARMGEHYGSTSRTYALAEEKWAEIEREWRANHDACVDAIVARASAGGDGASRSMGLVWRRLEDGVPTGVPRGLGAEGKFPERGDEDIVGPMVREAAMAHGYRGSRARSEDRYGRARDRQHHQHGRFWKNLVEKVERVGRKR